MIKSLYLRMIIAVAIAAMYACQPPTEEKEQLQQENEELRKQLESHQENVDGYFSALNEIELNLLEIKDTEDLITGETQQGIEFSANQEDRINEYIRSIGELMEQNRILIDRLRRSASQPNIKLEEFEKTIVRLTRIIEEREIEIQVLKEHLSQMNLRVDYLIARIDTLEDESEKKARLIRQQSEQLNQAFYAIGSRRELTDNNVISREGGFLGIGKSNRMKADFNHDFFTRINISHEKEIHILGDRPELITLHPENSYEIAQDEEMHILLIKDPDAFWGTGRYLVIMIR